MNPKVSVIIPIYNVEKYLKECLDSVINQTLGNIEIICVDDGGKDNCPQIIDEYAQKDNRIVAIHKPNGGYGNSMNVGLEKATGEYIAILEPDDYIDSKMYEDLYNIAKQYDSDIVKSGFYNNFDIQQKKEMVLEPWDNDNIPQHRSFKLDEHPQFVYYHPSIWTCIYKREFLNKNNIRFVEAPGAGWTDNPFQVQTMCLAERINYTPKAYYYWRRLSKNPSDDLKDYTVPFNRIDEIHNWLDTNNINDKSILECLYVREMIYISIVFGMKNIKDFSDCMRRIKATCKRMNRNIIMNSTICSKRDKRLYSQISFSVYLAYWSNLFKLYRKRIIRIRWNKEEKSITLFGFNWTRV